MSTIPAWKASRLDLAAEDANVGYGGSIFLGHPGLVVTGAWIFPLIGLPESLSYPG